MMTIESHYLLAVVFMVGDAVPLVFVKEANNKGACGAGGVLAAGF
jgi:hypothetical protein